jgi:hypothetical protein
VAGRRCGVDGCGRDITRAHTLCGPASPAVFHPDSMT